MSLKSNLAATDTHWGMLERKAGNLDLALTKFQQGAALNEELIKAEPGNPQWANFVAPSLSQYRGDLRAAQPAQRRARLLPALP